MSRSSRRTSISRAARPAAWDPTPPSDPSSPQTSPRFGRRPWRRSCRSKRPACKRAQPDPTISTRHKRKASEERGSGRKKHSNEASWFGRNFARIGRAGSSKRESYKVSLALQPEARAGGSNRVIQVLINDRFSLPSAASCMRSAVRRASGPSQIPDGGRRCGRKCVCRTRKKPPPDAEAVESGEGISLFSGRRVATSIGQFANGTDASSHRNLVQPGAVAPGFGLCRVPHRSRGHHRR